MQTIKLEEINKKSNAQMHNTRTHTVSVVSYYSFSGCTYCGKMIFHSHT